jgi:hypothetical protein
MAPQTAYIITAEGQLQFRAAGIAVERAGRLIKVVELSHDGTKRREIAATVLKKQVIRIGEETPAPAGKFDGTYVRTAYTTLRFPLSVYTLTTASEMTIVEVYEASTSQALDGIYARLGERFDSPPKEFELKAVLRLRPGVLIGRGDMVPTESAAQT